MRGRRFKAPTLQEALIQVREDLGADAVLVSERIVRPRMPWLGREHVEVVATPAAAPAPANAAGHAGAASALAGTGNGASAAQERAGRRGGADAAARPADAASGQRPRAEAQEPAPFHERSAPALEVEIREMRRAIAQLAAWTTPRIPRLEEIAGHLVEAGMSLEMAREFALAAEDHSDDALCAVRTAIASRLRGCGPIDVLAGRKVVALVGPTGVGKTTTLAKLAAYYSISERLRVGLMTLDGFRVGAVEQMRIYAHLMEVPLAVATTLEELPAAMDRCRELDVVLVDTMGHAPQDALALAQTAEMLRALRPDEVHLALAAPTDRRTLATAVERFSRLEPTALLFTKLDEAQTFGGAVEVAVRAGKPISYVTDGQEVPGCILPARADRLAARVAYWEDGS